VTPAIATRPSESTNETEPGPGNDQAHESGPERPQYRVKPQDDGGTWRGPTEAAWTTRILRGARPPKQPTGLSGEASEPRP
jgi:hypothetical protein